MICNDLDKNLELKNSTPSFATAAVQPHLCMFNTETDEYTELQASLSHKGNFKSSVYIPQTKSMTQKIL